MSEHSNSKNFNYSNFSFANYLKNPTDIGKNEYENYPNNNLEEYAENFNSWIIINLKTFLTLEFLLNLYLLVFD